MSHKIIQGDNVATLKTLADNSVDSIITDPPYGIEFLGKDWDSNTGAVETWQECLRVLKPGGYLLAFSAARTYHHLATNIESVGFEIRDQLMWLYASGFPKAQDIGKAIQKRLGVEETKPYEWNAPVKGGRASTNDLGKGNFATGKDDIKVTSPDAKQWSGWKTALKPAHEPVVMARKPFRGSTIDNVLKHGVGALNIDESRVAYEGVDTRQGGANGWSRTEFGEKEPVKYKDQKSTKPGISKIGRDPRNNLKSNGVESDIPYTEAEWTPSDKGRYPSNVLGEIPDYQKYFYCPKVSRKERHCGFEQDPISHLDMVTEMGGYYVDEKGNKDDSRNGGGNMIWLPHLGKIYTHGLKHEYEEWCKKHKRNQLAHIPTSKGGMLGTDGEWAPEHWHGEKGQKNKDPLAHIPGDSTGKRYYCEIEQRKAVGNNHPTVKPVALMRWLIQLVTPAGGKVLDPFTGSGSTGMAAVELGHEFIGCELDPNYVAIANRRIEGWNRPKPNNSTFEDIFDAFE